MDGAQLFSLKWNNYLSHITDAFDSLRSEENLVDVTLSCDGYKIKAHKMLLSACSTYFKDLFKDNPCQHPIVVFRNVKFYDLRALIDFIYQGEVNVMQDHLSSFLATAKFLEVKGLADNSFGADNEGSLNHDMEYEDENASEHIEEEDIEEDGNLSDDISQYPITAPPSIPSNDMKSCPLTIIPINNNNKAGGGGGGGGVPEYQNSKRRKRPENNGGGGGGASASHHEEELYQRRSFLQNLKSQQTTIKPENINNEMPTLSFTTKQSVEIFPITTVKTEKNDDYENLPSHTTSMKEYSPRNDMSEGYGAAEEAYAKTNLELNHLLSKTQSVAVAGNEMAQDSLQGHWLSSLNNSSDCADSGVVAGANEVSNKKSAVASTVDFSQQRHRYICSICGATYKHLRNLRAHCHLHYGKTRCNLCNKVLCNISYFKKHLQQQHGLLSTKKTDGKNLPPPSTTTSLNSAS